VVLLPVTINNPARKIQLVIEIANAILPGD
jgi:hypothetical protein